MLRATTCILALVAIGLIAAGEAQARGRRSCCQPAAACCQPAAVDQAAAPTPADVPAAAQTDPNARRFSVQPSPQPVYTYPTYRPSYRPMDRFLLPKTDARRFST